MHVCLAAVHHDSRSKTSQSNADQLLQVRRDSMLLTMLLLCINCIPHCCNPWILCRVEFSQARVPRANTPLSAADRG